MEKRAVGFVHEVLSLTVEKMVEVEKISHFRNWFGIDLNVKDLFLDHPGMFYLSTKGKRHTGFLREAYERGCLIESNLVYEARRKLLDLVLLSCHGLGRGDINPIVLTRVKKMKWKRCIMIEAYCRLKLFTHCGIAKL
ncbi:protein ROOT PRIMORDIUM defective [Sesamum angolense]|uniref:Protein ROOT PRIMORDIUM defective n=1 Tax=Sesamum angolense TaxID=2727404 RepID=A0AAE1T3T2_9LAMI|nr:protein ROOT PRIMORDIUM defective [Sesamum angolense]